MRRIAAAAAAAALPAPTSAQLPVEVRLHVHEPFFVVPDLMLVHLANVPWLSLGALPVLTVALAAMVHRRMAKARHKSRIALLGVGRGQAFMLVDVLCHAIRKGRSIHPARLERALQIARDLTEMDYTEDHLREAARRADTIVTPLTFSWMRGALSDADRRRIFETTLAVMIEAGPLGHGDRAFLRTLTGAIGLRPEDTGDLGWLIPA